MDKWRLKWWQSGLLGALIGFGIFYAQYSIPREHSRTWGGQAFFKSCLKRRPGEPASFKGLVLTPQMDGSYTVNGSHFSHHAYQTFVCEVPPGADMGEPQVAVPGGGGIAMQVPLPAGTGFMGMMQEYARQFPWVQFEYKWWREPHLLLWAYPMIGAFLLGIVFPLLTHVWQGGGMWPAKAEEKYDLEKFKPEAEATKDSTLPPTEADLAQLGAALAAVQRGAAGTMPGKLMVPTNATLAASPVKLGNESLAVTGPATNDTEKDFKGDFYPTEVHGEKDIKNANK